jgi:hypothetical protein
MALSLTRPTDPPKFFESWEAYLAAWSGVSDATLCRVLLDNYATLVEPEWTTKEDEIASYRRMGAHEDLLEALTEAEEDLTRIRRRTGVPWLTPVVGSGCLSADKGPDSGDVKLVPGQVAAAAATWGLLPDGSLKRDVAERFARSMLRAKLATDERPPDNSTAVSSPPPDRTIAAHALLCAQLLSTLYFEVGAMQEGPIEALSVPCRFDRELGGPTPRGAELYDSCVVPLLAELASLQHAVAARLPAASSVDLKFVNDFADAVRSDLTAFRPQVRGSDAALMAEISWHFMVEGTPQYPGWSDLLVLLSFSFNSTDRQHRWPHLTDLDTARQVLARELKWTTKRSWQSRIRHAEESAARDEESASHREQFYDAVASILVAQAGLSTPETSHHQESYPPAVAFVTSFDLELEMALLAKQVPFRLIVPFYVRRSASSKAAGYVWLQTVVVPPTDAELGEHQLNALYQPREWSLVIDSARWEADKPGVPAVVRLAGSPLITGPDLEKATYPWVARLREQLGDPTALVGTVLLDEHTALQQWAAELDKPANRDAAPGDRLGLPEQFVAGKEETDARFWFVIGVQLGDDAIRHRTAAIVGAADLRNGVGSKHQARRPRRAGVVINRRSTPYQREVFLWQGLDVVETNYAEVTSALRHVAQHATKPAARRLKGEKCRLAETLA